MKPILLINFKTYPSATGKKAVELAKVCDDAAKETGTEIYVSVQATDISRVSGKIVAQHVDYFDQGRATGFILPEAVKEAGAIGSLINHAEHRLKLDIIEKTIAKCKQLNLKTFVCAANLEEGKKIAKFEPDYIAFEDPALISTGISISKTKPDSVRDFADAIKKINPEIGVLCGAGISNGSDVKAALELGCVGVLAATAVTEADDPKQILLDMCSQA